MKLLFTDATAQGTDVTVSATLTDDKGETHDRSFRIQQASTLTEDDILHEALGEINRFKAEVATVALAETLIGQEFTDTELEEKEQEPA